MGDGVVGEFVELDVARGSFPLPVGELGVEGHRFESGSFHGAPVVGGTDVESFVRAQVVAAVRNEFPGVSDQGGAVGHVVSVLRDEFEVRVLVLDDDFLAYPPAAECFRGVGGAVKLLGGS